MWKQNTDTTIAANITNRNLYPKEEAFTREQSNSILINTVRPRYWQNDLLLFHESDTKRVKEKRRTAVLLWPGAWKLRQADGRRNRGSTYGWENQRRTAQSLNWLPSDNQFLLSVRELLISQFHFPITRGTHKTNTRTQQFCKTI